MMRRKLKLSDLNPHLMCVLCGGYYIDATTIVECLHSFCRSCIVKHLESSKYCPICEVQVHKTKPLINIRPDKTLQDIVYKLVPGLYASEMKNRRKFYKERPHYMKPNDSESVGEVSDDGMFSINDEYITLSLSYHISNKQASPDGFQEIASPDKSEQRYFKCPTAVTVFHLQKLLKAKYELNDNNYKVELFFKDQPLHKDFTLLDIAYVYLSKNKGALDLTYLIFESVVKRQKIDIKAEPETELEKVKDEKPEVKLLEKESQSVAPPSQTENQSQTPEVAPSSDVKLPEAKSTDKANDTKPQIIQPEKVKENGVKNSEPKEVLLQISESGVMSVSEVENSAVIRTVEEPTPKNVNNQSNTGMSQAEKNKIKTEPDNKEKINRLVPEQAKYLPKTVKPYKTIRCSPNAWHPVITKEKLRPTLMKNSDEPKKPPKFFKLRNAPRFLGNPSSGVKPMYGEAFKEKVTETKKAEKKSTDHTKTLKKILKIDPKTLRPIEKDELSIVPTTPNAPNLLTNPFIPNNNHFLFSDPQLLPPNSGNYSNSSKSDPKPSEKSPSSSKSPLPNGSYSPIRFPAPPDYAPNFYPYHPNFPKIPNLFPVNDKMDPFNRAPRLSPFGNLTGFNVAGFHASLPPSISLLFNPHHHIKKLNPASDKNVNSKEESTKETNKNCDDNSLKINKKIENVNNNMRMLVNDDNCKDGKKKVEIGKSKNVAGDNKKNNKDIKGKNGKDVKGITSVDKKEKDMIKDKDVIKNKAVKKDKEDGNNQIKEKEDSSKCNDNNKIDKDEPKTNNDNKELGKEEKEKETKYTKDDNTSNTKVDKIVDDSKDEKVDDKNNKDDNKSKNDDNKDNKNNDDKDNKGNDDNKDNRDDNKDNDDNNDKKDDNEDKKDDNKDKSTVESCNNTVDDGKCNSSACNDETKTETVNNDNKSVNDKER